jgi:hypothetical protein
MHITYVTLLCRKYTNKILSNGIISYTLTFMYGLKIKRMTTTCHKTWEIKNVLSDLINASVCTRENGILSKASK